MKKGINPIRSKGFTLIEVLVTVVVIGVLAAVVIPAVTAQVSAGDSSRVISDLNNVRTGIENFDIAVRQYPGDVDDLVNSPGTATSTGSGATIDADISGALYPSGNSWSGPYMETALPSAVASSTVNVSAAAFKTGYSATVNNRFLACNIGTETAGCAGSNPNYVAIEIDALTAVQASTLNNLIDGTETTASSTGKFRFVSDAVSSTGYYYATPFK